jgi:putative DNA primase/helicase
VNFENPEQIKQAQIDNIFNMLRGGLHEAQIRGVLYGSDADELFQTAKAKFEASIAPAIAPTIAPAISEVSSLPVSLPVLPAPIWETPTHREVDPFDPDYDAVMLASECTSPPAVPPLVPPRMIQTEPTDPLPFVPAVLKEMRNWVLWRLETVNGRLTKVPYQVNGNKAKSDDPATWNTYEAVISVATINAQGGIGIMTDGTFIGWDLDGCRNPQTGEITAWAQSIIDALDAYTEITPSGFGVRAYTRGELPDGPSRFSIALSAGFGDKVGIEAYDHARYFTVTGNRLGNSATLTSQNIAQTYKMCADTSKQFPSEKRCKASSDSVDDGGSVRVKMSGTSVTTKLALLMYGDIIPNSRPFIVSDSAGNSVQYDSQSEADMALATLLAMKYDDPEKIDEKFRESVLYRPKWDRLAEKTIQKAIASAKRVAEKQAADNGTSSTNNGTGSQTKQTESESIPIVDDPSEEEDPRLEMPGETFDTKVYEDMSRRFTLYPDPGDDLISGLAKKLVEGTPISVAYVREPLKAIVLHAIDGKVIHPAHRKLTLRGNCFNLGPSEGGKTTGLEYALQAGNLIFTSCQIHQESLFRYKSEQTFLRSFTPEGTIKRDAQGKIKSGEAGYSSQFLHIKEGNLVANSSDYFGAVFSQITNLYDQTEAGTESMTNGVFNAKTIKVSTVMCFTPTDFVATFGGKGTIGGGGLNRWGLVNPPEDHSYDERDWEPVSDAEIQAAISPLASKVFELRQGDPIVLIEEEGATKIRLETKAMLRKAGVAGKRLLEYFIREQVAQAVVALDGRLVMTEAQAAYAKRWVEAQLDCRLNCWPSDANNQIEGMEHAIRKTVNRHHVSERKLKDACHFYREGSGGWFAFNAARNNMLASEAIKLTGKSRKGTKLYCPGSCGTHPAVKEVKEDNKTKK